MMWQNKVEWALSIVTKIKYNNSVKWRKIGQFASELTNINT
jgi:hypothetical protein